MPVIHNGGGGTGRKQQGQGQGNKQGLAVTKPADVAPTSTPVEQATVALNTTSDVAEQPVVEQAPVVETPAVEAPAPTPSPASGTVVSDSAGPVGQIAEDVANTAGEFLEKVRTAAETVRLTELGIINFPEEVQTAILNILETGSPLAKAFMGDVLSYIKKMDPKAMMTEEVGRLEQSRFFATVRNFIENASNDFRHVFQVFLAIIHEVKEEGAFSLTHIFRFMSTMQMPQEDRHAYQRLMTAFRQTSHAPSRALALKQIDLAVMTEYGLSAKARNTLIAFYKT